MAEKEQVLAKMAVVLICVHVHSSLKSVYVFVTNWVVFEHQNFVNVLAAK